MPKWKKDETDYSVNVSYNTEKGSKVNMPIPILEKLGNPEKITFVVDKSGKVIVEAFKAWEKEQKRLRKESKEIG
jgi:hypothetical protein